jgi:hypothetical protein
LAQACDSCAHTPLREDLREERSAPSLLYARQLVFFRPMQRVPQIYRMVHAARSVGGDLQDFDSMRRTVAESVYLRTPSERG